mmetsp:Transcript_35440/g.104821  ORF Transcript_35440/g.104821 Transcript_35440/m.104821 type:complete len:229 (+) Transcript_35440:128-814(+)
MLLNELGQRLEVALAALILHLLLASSREEDQRRVALHFDTLVLVLRAVHLRNHNAVNGLETFGQLAVDGRQLLAVAAPWRIHLQQHVLVLGQHNLLKCLAHDNGHTVLCWALRRLCRLVARLEGPIKQGLCKRLDRLSAESLRHHKLLCCLHVEAQDDGSIPAGSKVVTNGLTTLAVLVNCHAHKLALERLAGFLERLKRGGIGRQVGRRGPKEDLFGDTRVEDLLRG